VKLVQRLTDTDPAGRGARFELRLPLADPPPDPSSPAVLAYAASRR
jgi:hypothetical protein